MNSNMSYDEAVQHYRRWSKDRSLLPQQPIQDLSAFIDGKWYLEDEDGVLASVDEHGDVWQGDNPYLTMEDFRLLALKHNGDVSNKPPIVKSNPNIATGINECGTLSVRMTQGNQICEVTLPELKEILQAVADAKKTPSDNKSIYESSTARLDALGKNQKRTVRVWIEGSELVIHVAEFCLDQIKDTSVILHASGQIVVDPGYLKSVIIAVEKRK